jgi:hypothetical protein
MTGEAYPMLDREAARAFLRRLDSTTDVFVFQTFDDSAARRRALARTFHGTLEQHWVQLETLSRQGAGVFVCINKTDQNGKRTTESVTFVRAYFADFDGVPPQAIKESLARFGLTPHLVIESSRGKWHVYWFIVGALLGEFSSTQARLAAVLGSDPSVKDLPRVMRLPGSHHQKDGCALSIVRIAGAFDHPSFSNAEFQAALNAAERNASAGPNESRSVAAGVAAGLRSTLDMTQGYPDGQRTHELTRRAGCCLGQQHMTESETVAACLAWNRYNTPPLPEEKVRATVASIAKSEMRKREAASQRADVVPVSKGENDTADHVPKSTQREKLILVGLAGELWHDSDSNAFATVEIGQHKESYSIRSTAYRHWLTREFGERHRVTIGNETCPSAPSAQALTEASNALTAKANSGAEYQPAVRVAGLNQLVYIDLGQPQWNAVEVSPDSWRVVQETPIRFVRPKGLRPMVTPVHGGCLSDLRQFVNVRSDQDFLLVIAWLTAALRPTGPYPVLIINGEQGAGKSISCRVIRRLIDPNAAELRTQPKDERDLLLAAKNGWVVSLDNVSYVKNDLSDAICRLATKGAFATRALYTDDEEFLLEVCRPALLNGIPPLASRADLADRSVILVLPSMDNAKRRSEDEFWEAFQAAAPRILGALVDALSGALRSLPSIELRTATRMMDFAKWGEAICRHLGASPGTFETAYAANRFSANDDAVDADPVASAVMNLMNKQTRFLGTATQLMPTLETFSPQSRQDRRWPKDATRLSGQLRRAAPLCRPRGVEINFDQRSPDAARTRLIEIKLVGSK